MSTNNVTNIVIRDFFGTVVVTTTRHGYVSSHRFWSASNLFLLFGFSIGVGLALFLPRPSPEEKSS